MRTCERSVLFMGLVSAAGCVASEGAAPERAAPEHTATTRQSVTLNDRIAACTNDPRVVFTRVTEIAQKGARSKKG